MIESLRIRDLGVIAEAELTLHPGLTVLTGETGAGKTMVLTGLGLVLGDRAEPHRVRPGAARTVVEAAITAPPGSPAGSLVVAAGGELDEDGTLVLLRTVSTEGRSRAHAGGTAVPAATLASLAGHLVTVHGQADQRRLVRPAVQRDLLDAYAETIGEGSHAARLADHRAAYAELAQLQTEVRELREAALHRSREQEMLRHGLAEIAAVDPREGEDDELAAEQSRLGAAVDLTRAARTVHDALAGDRDGSVRSLLTAAERGATELAGRDRALDVIAERLRAMAVDAEDIAADAASYAGGLEPDPVRLAMIGERREVLARLARRYPAPDVPAPDVPAPGIPGGIPADLRGDLRDDLRDGAGGHGPGGSTDPVMAWAVAAEQRLLELDDASDRIQTLLGRVGQLTAALTSSAAAITGARIDAARRLAGAVTTEISALGMSKARMSVVVAPRSTAGLVIADAPGGGSRTIGPSGADEVTLALVPHPGADPVGLGSGVSGGELSRVMLALEVVLAATSGTPTYIFDEVDAGIGGRTAAQVGHRLARLAATRQVVVVTHLAQVAAHADRHLVVVRDETGSITRSGVSEVSGGARVAELARMLSGSPDSATARAHADQLLTAAVGRAAPERGPGVVAS